MLAHRARTITCLLMLLIGVPATTVQSAGAAETALRAAPRDGRHDFDFNVGRWRTRISRVLDPFASPTRAVELNGTVTVRPVWAGRAQLEEIDAEGPDGRLEGLTLFLYAPGSHEWTQTFISSSTGDRSPPLVGEFVDGRGVLFSQDTFHGRSILVRAVWSEIAADAHRFVEEYSDDGGQTWAPAFAAQLTRAPSGMSATRAASRDPQTRVRRARDGQHDFDFDIGSWETHSSRLLQPLSGSTTWIDMDGVTVVSKVWGGRANLAEFSADGPAGRLELLSLRWYNPETGQWSLGFATPDVGKMGTASVGEFRNGRGDFYDQETFNGRTILVRFSIWAITDDTARSEQAFSDDGGKTWETNWINVYRRAAS